MLEQSASVELARRKPTAAGELHRLARAVKAAVAREDVPAYIEGDRAFHHEFVAQVGNALLTRLVREARDAMRLYGIDTSAGREWQQASVREHFELVALAENGATKEIGKLISQHILPWKPIFHAGHRTPRHHCALRRRLHVARCSLQSDVQEFQPGRMGSNTTQRKAQAVILAVNVTDYRKWWLTAD